MAPSGEASGVVWVLLARCYLGLLAGTHLWTTDRRKNDRPARVWIRWESVTHSTSTVVWFFMLLGPFGDAPYYLAGLSRVSFVKILIITSILRIPSVFFAAAAGGGTPYHGGNWL